MVRITVTANLILFITNDKDTWYSFLIKKMQQLKNTTDKDRNHAPNQFFTKIKKTIEEYRIKTTFRHQFERNKFG